MNWDLPAADRFETVPCVTAVSVYPRNFQLLPEFHHLVLVIGNQWSKQPISTMMGRLFAQPVNLVEELWGIVFHRHRRLPAYSYVDVEPFASRDVEGLRVRQPDEQEYGVPARVPPFQDPV